MKQEHYLRVFFSVRSAFISRLIAKYQNGISHCGFMFRLPRIISPWILESKGHGGFGYSDDDEFADNVTIVEEYAIAWSNDERLAFI